MGFRRVFLILSLAIISFSVVSFVGLTKFNKGIDFTGGLSAQLNTYFSKMDVLTLRKLFASVTVIKILADGTKEPMTVNLGRNISSLETSGSALPVVKGVTDHGSGYLVRVKNFKGEGWIVKKEELEKALNRLLRKQFKPQAKLVFQLEPGEGATKAELALLLKKAGNFSIHDVMVKIGSGKQIKRFLVSGDLSYHYKATADRIKAALAAQRDVKLAGDITASGVLYTVVLDGASDTETKLKIEKIFKGIRYNRVLSEPAGSGMSRYTVRGRVLDESELRTRIEGIFGPDSRFTLIRNSRSREKVDFLYAFNWKSFTAVSATIGEEVESSAFMLAIGVALVILFYIAIRFDYRFGFAAVSALLHDVCIMLGVISVMQIELNVPIIAAILTILGYSINDTIVVFDRIRENLVFTRKEDLPEVINRSVTRSLSRTVITSVTTLLAVLAIYFSAGANLKDFAFTLIIGIIVGTYSSIYIASPVYLFIEKVTGVKELQKKKKPATV